MSKKTLTPPPKKRPDRSKWFGCIIYEDNPNHLRVYQYIHHNHNLYPSVLSIRHDRDVCLEDTKEHKKGDPKKTHYHVLFQTCDMTTANGLIKRFCGLVDYFEVIHSPVSSALYLTHTDFESTILGKYVYDKSEIRLEGNGGDTYNSAYGNKDCEMHWDELINLLSQVEDKGLVSALKSYSLASFADPYTARRYWQTLSKFQGLVMRADSARYEVQKQKIITEELRLRLSREVDEHYDTLERIHELYEQA